MAINIRFLEKFFADLVNNIEFKRTNKILIKNDLISDIDDQRAHHFYTYINDWAWSKILYSQLIIFYVFMD